jgi:hypothetical protein
MASRAALAFCRPAHISRKPPFLTNRTVSCKVSLRAGQYPLERRRLEPNSTSGKYVEGDFTAQVKVTGEFKPGEKAAAENTRPFNSAGLLLWQDEKNYIRLERNRWWVAEAGQYACYPPLIEQYKDGEYQGTNPQATPDEFFKGNSTWLRIERQGKKVTASLSHDGKEWTEAKEITVELPKKVQIGVAVVNTAANVLTVEFE